MMEADTRDPLTARYDALWADAAAAVRAGRITPDRWALHKADDARRGITLLARPEPAVAERVTAFVDELRAIEPAQYYQPRSDLHLTVLSLFTATAEYHAHLARVDQYQSAVVEAVAGTPPFAIDFRGVTLSSGAVLVQGFPQDDVLPRLRERLRATLATRELAGGLDQRYRLETAHLTVARFASPLRDAQRFVDALGAARQLAFGTWNVTRVELVFHDWYQSSERERPLAVYELDQPERDA